MILEIFGNDAEGYAAHGEYEDGVDEPLLDCPFCNWNEIGVSNTHTPYYTASCLNCGAEGPDTNNEAIPGWDAEWFPFKTKEAARNLHQLAFKQAIIEWNTRGSN